MWIERATVCNLDGRNWRSGCEDRILSGDLVTARKLKWVVSVKWMMVEVCSGVLNCIGHVMLML